MVEGDPRHKEPTSGCIVGNAYDDYIGICGNLHDIDIPMQIVDVDGAQTLGGVIELSREETFLGGQVLQSNLGIYDAFG